MQSALPMDTVLPMYLDEFSEKEKFETHFEMSFCLGVDLNH